MCNTTDRKRERGRATKEGWGRGRGRRAERAMRDEEMKGGVESRRPEW